MTSRERERELERKQLINLNRIETGCKYRLLLLQNERIGSSSDYFIAWEKVEQGKVVDYQKIFGISMTINKDGRQEQIYKFAGYLSKSSI